VFHRLLAGHFKADAVVSSRTLNVVRPIDLEAVSRLVEEAGLEGDGRTFKIAGDTMKIADGYVDCPWLMPQVNRESVKFMLRLCEETECMFVDLGHGEVVDTGVLRESIAAAR